MFQGMIAAALDPFIDRITELEQHVEELSRRGGNHVRLGYCVSVGAGRCVVKSGDNTTPAIKWFSVAAGETRDHRAPSVGEQCLLFNFGAGDNGAQSVALFGLPSAAYPLPTTELNLTPRLHKDGATRTYDHDAHRDTFENGPVKIASDHSGIEILLAGVGLKIDAGGVHILGPSLDHEGVNVGNTHVHAQKPDSDGNKQEDTEVPK